jgi:hypothetical protein
MQFEPALTLASHLIPFKSIRMKTFEICEMSLIVCTIGCMDLIAALYISSSAY